MINELMKISTYAGMREDLVQAGGGNSSVKFDGAEMLIKASGCLLSEINESFGYSHINYLHLIKSLESGQQTEQEILSTSVISGTRPSIESFLHALTKRVTLHTHPTLVNVFSVRKNGLEDLKKLFPESLLIDYYTPGVGLARLVSSELKKLNKENQVQIIFLKNHGLVVSADTADEVILVTEAIIQKLAQYLNLDYSCYSNVYPLYEKLVTFNLMLDKDVLYLSTDLFIQKYLDTHKKGWMYGFCPDCLVYCHKKMMEVTDLLTEKTVKEFLSKNGLPNIFVYKQHLYIVAPTLKKAREIESVLRMSVQIAILNQNEDIDYLTNEEQNFLLNWEAEKYRQQKA